MKTVQKQYHIINYGCQMNESDSEHLAGQLQALAYRSTLQMDQADIIVLNTCCVRESAENKILGKIGELKRLKTQNPNLIICVAGCLAQKEGESLRQTFPHIDLVLGTHSITKFGEIVTDFKKKLQPQIAITADGSIPEFSNITERNSSISAWVPITYGCNNYCTYCIVPYVRGRERSRPPEDVLHEAQLLAVNGYKEITLLGQNVNSYGKDKSNYPDFAELLTEVDNIPGLERIRYMTSHPRDMNEKVISVIANSKHICEHFHLPVQAGSDPILQKMNRGYTRSDYINLINTVRQLVPAANITTDIIVGFPGETEEMFADTMSLIEEIRFDTAYTFIYSIRSGTPAAKFPNQIPLAVKKHRLQQLMDKQNEISLALNLPLVGKILEVMVEGDSKKNPNTLTGRTRTNKIIIWDKSDCPPQPGTFVKVKITSAQTWILKGREVSDHD